MPFMQGESFVRISRRRRRMRNKSRFWARVRTAFLFVCALGILGVVAAFATFSYTYATVADDLPDLDDYSSTELAQTSIVYDADGNVVDELYGVQNRFVVGLDEINPTLQNAVVAIEDHRFYDHRGLDFEAIARAARQNIETMSIREGGSTITQQLIKNTYIAQEQRSIPSFQRKMTEASLAWQYEKDHSKKEILEQYLNTVYFGANAYGAEAAAKTYFNKKAADLTLAESAMLAGIINLPSAYDPFADPESATKRRNVVLDNMLRYGYIDEKEHEAAVGSELDLSRGRVQYENDNEYFLDAVRKELAKEFGDDTVYEGGLKIYTTLDPELQELANGAVDSVVDPASGDPSASLVSVEPGTGAVRAMVGGSDFEQVKFNLATQAKRQPGSSFKPFVLAEAIDQGVSPETTYESKALNIPLPAGSEEPYYEVNNYAFIERGPITIEEATAQSDNTVFVQLALDLGMENVVDMANKMGIVSEVEPYPSTAIGGLGQGVNPLEMASAYSTFPNGGVHMEPFLVERVTREEDGEEVVVEEHRLKGERALSKDEAAVAVEVMRGVVERGTASQFHDLDSEIGRPSAGKTGTTEEFADAWYVGFIPQLSTSVWVGYPGERRPMVNINGLAEINGENYPLDIWSNYMQGAVQFYPVQQFDVPSPSLNLQIKKSGRAYDSPETTRERTSGRGSEDEETVFFVPAEPAPQAATPQPAPQPVQPQPAPAPQPVQPAPAPQPVQPAPAPGGGGGGGGGGGNPGGGNGFPGSDVFDDSLFD
jgi:penicillin-binding protein 1A